MFYTPEDLADGLPGRLLGKAERDGRVHHAGWRVRRDGTRFWGDVTITALHDEQGRHTGFTKMTRDLTVRHFQEQDRQAFLATLAHDYRGPIQAIAGYAEMLPDAGEHQDVFIEKIRSNADRLLRMTDSLLDLAHTDSTEGELHPASVDALEVARSTVAALRSPEDNARVTVAAGSCLVMVDPASLERMVSNLVTNAITYSADGSIDVDVVPGEGRQTIRVRDHGRGIHPDDLESILGAYERGRYADSDDGGTGLGLASVKRLAERQGGSIRIESAVGIGTTVCVELPDG